MDRNTLALESIGAQVEAARQGNREAFAALYRSHADRVYRYCLARLSDTGAAEDVTATVFMRAWQAIERYQPTGAPFAAWLFRIAHNEVVSHLRRARRPSDSSLGELDLVATDPAARSDELAVRQALQQLTELQRQVIAYRFAAGLTHMEIAELMGRNANAVKQLQHSAIVRLRRLLAVAGDAGDA